MGEFKSYPREVGTMFVPGCFSGRTFRLFVVLLSCSFTLAADCQTVPAQATRLAVTETSLNASPDLSSWTLQIVRNPLQADPKIIAAFMRPWLLSDRLLTADSKSTRSLPQPKSYKLTPDPSSWT